MINPSATLTGTVARKACTSLEPAYGVRDTHPVIRMARQGQIPLPLGCRITDCLAHCLAAAPGGELFSLGLAKPVGVIPAMLFKLLQSAQKGWNRLKVIELLTPVVNNQWSITCRFKDGEKVENAASDRSVT